MGRKTSAEYEADQKKLQDELAALDTKQDWADADVARSEQIPVEFAALEVERVKAVQHEKQLEVVRSAALSGRTESADGATVRRGPEVKRSVDPFEVLRSSAGLSGQEITRALVDANLKAIEDRDLWDSENEKHFERTIKRHASDHVWARNILSRQRDEYQSAWAKLMTGRPELLDEVERAAVQAGSNPLGGYLVPTHLDPTIILTNSGTSNVIRGLSRVVTLTEGNVWHGVTSAGVTASFDAELTEVSDDSPTFGSPSVTLFMAKSLVRASLEAFRDIANLGPDVMMMFADARDRLEGSKHAVGSGSGEPKGIVTALDANTNVEIISTTAATIGLVDIHSVYRQVPVRWRGRSTWLTNPVYSLAIKSLDTALSASYTTDLTQGTAGTMLGRPLVESDDMPTTQTTSANDNEVILGDFSNFVVVDKPGSMAVDFIPHLFSTTTNLPDGSRAWYCYWSNGSNSVNDLAFRLLQDKTG